MLRVVGLTKKFPGDPPFLALDHVSFEVSSGEIFGFIGESGAGKSTLIRCLAGLETPTSGQIFLKNEEITSLDKKKKQSSRQEMGMIFQQFHLFTARSVLENVLFPLEIRGFSKQAARETALQLLERVGMLVKKDAFPTQLSGGEKQRVAIARALACNPSILFCDEATSALDPSTTRSILRLLKDLNQSSGITIVLITHEMEVVKEICTSVAVLEKGKIVEKGAVVDLFLLPTHPMTRQFLQRLPHEVPAVSSANKKALYRLSFKGSKVEKPLICHMIKTYGIDVNILSGSIDQVGQTSVGSLVVELLGDEVSQARHFLEQQGVTCEEFRCTKT